MPPPLENKILMNLTALLTGALLLAAPLFSQIPAASDPQIRKGAIVWFELKETTEQVTRMLGHPTLVADFGPDLLSWQYQIDNEDHDEFSHQLVFRKSDHALISITRTYSVERNVDELFPAGETTVYHYPNAETPQYSVRLRRLPNGRVLMAMGSAKPGQTTTQLELVRQAELPTF